MAFDTTRAGPAQHPQLGAGLGPNNGGFPQIGGVAYSYDPTLPGNVGTTPSSRIRDLSLIDENGNVIVKLVENGVILQDVPSLITVVTLNFTANGGDGYPDQGQWRELPLPARRWNAVGSRGRGARLHRPRPALPEAEPPRPMCWASKRRFRILFPRTSAPRRRPTTRPTPRSRVTFASRTRRFVPTPCSTLRP